MKNKFLNIKVGKEFDEVLTRHPFFAKNWKAVSPSLHLLKRIAKYNAQRDGELVEVFSGDIAKIFQPYTDGQYMPYLKALETLNILEIEYSADFQGNKNGKLKPGERGVCNKYRVTDYGCGLIHSSNMEYLRKLHSDPHTRRLNQQKVSNRKVMSKTYTDPLLAYLYDGLVNISYNHDLYEEVLKKSLWSKPQHANVSDTFEILTTKKFGKLEVGEKDGRIHHEIVRLKSDARFLLRYKNTPYRATLDIRCCHPTFFSSYLLSHPYTLHLLTHNHDIQVKLEREHQKWIRLFCNPDADPKVIIQKACEFEEISYAKMAMNETLNGSKLYPDYLEWLKTKFPFLYQTWRKTVVKETGVNISKNYEQKLMLDQGLYAKATDLGIVKITPEHDGVGVFAEENDDQLPAKLASLAEYIKSVSVDLFGVPIFIKTKYVFNWASSDLFTAMQHQRSELDKEYDPLKYRMDCLRRKYFATKDAKSGEQLAAAKKKEEEILRRYKPVIEYWVERQKRGL